jgi:hypothetical protein
MGREPGERELGKISHYLQAGMKNL